MPGKYNFKIYRGETLRRVFIYKDATETAVDLSGYSARLQVRAKIDDTDVLLSLTTDNGGIEIVPLEGKIILHATAAATTAMTWTEGVYDLELYYMDGLVEDVTRLVEGRVSTVKEVTR